MAQRNPSVMKKNLLYTWTIQSEACVVPIDISDCRRVVTRVLVNGKDVSPEWDPLHGVWKTGCDLTGIPILAGSIGAWTLAYAEKLLSLRMRQLLIAVDMNMMGQALFMTE